MEGGKKWIILKWFFLWVISYRILIIARVGLILCVFKDNAQDKSMTLWTVHLFQFRVENVYAFVIFL